jgi:spoIIIJ-associated protein
MKTSLDVIAPTVEDAIQQGMAELGVPREQLLIEVLDEGGKGFLGLSERQARVRLSLRTDDDADVEQPEIAEVAPTATPEIAASDEDAVKATHQTVLDLLGHMDIEADIEARWGELDDKGKIRPLLVDVRGDDLSILIGRRGETLTALQYITRLIVAKQMEEPIAVVIDVQGYRARREQQLRKLARSMAKQAIELGRIMTLEPMPANERRIIHVELRENPQVQTESVGEGNRRKVTIIPSLS